MDFPVKNLLNTSGFIHPTVAETGEVVKRTPEESRGNQVGGAAGVCVCPTLHDP